jgi:uncharacterized protein YndB with AHSA1/START domain
MGLRLHGTFLPGVVRREPGYDGEVPRNEIDIPAPLDDVWEVLLDPSAYVRWVVGGRTVRDVDPGWPQPGNAFHHTAGMWPIVVKDKTVMVEVEPRRRLVLRAKARPAGEARVEITVEPVAEGTHIVLVEEPVSGPVRFLPRPLLEFLVKPRNAESLRRLRNLVEERSRAGS